MGGRRGDLQRGRFDEEREGVDRHSCRQGGRRCRRSPRGAPLGKMPSVLSGRPDKVAGVADSDVCWSSATMLNRGYWDRMPNVKSPNLDS
jgi:hypothetical protein